MPATQRILIADDDREDCMLTQKALSQTYAGNIDFTTEHNGEALLTRLAACAPNELPDLLLLDLNMPKIDGREALRHLRALPRYQALPIIVLTTSTLYDDIDAAYRLGANSYISKAVTFDGMLQAMATLTTYWFKLVMLPTAREPSTHE